MPRRSRQSTRSRNPDPLAARPPQAAGYSGTPLAKKLGIKPGMTVLLLAAPPGFADILDDVPDAVSFRSRTGAACDLSLWFVRAQKELDGGIARNAAAVPIGGLWICWPKKASGVKTDLTEDHVRNAGLAHGIVDYKVAAIDHTWSGLKFARRKPARTA